MYPNIFRAAGDPRPYWSACSTCPFRVTITYSGHALQVSDILHTKDISGHLILLCLSWPENRVHAVLSWNYLWSHIGTFPDCSTYQINHNIRLIRFSWNTYWFHEITDHLQCLIWIFTDHGWSFKQFYFNSCCGGHHTQWDERTCSGVNTTITMYVAAREDHVPRNALYVW